MKALRWIARLGRLGEWAVVAVALAAFLAGLL